VNDFAHLNTKMAKNNTRLEGELLPLKETEQKLAAIAEKNGSDVNKLRDLVKQNQKCQNEMKEDLKFGVVQDMMDAVLNAERSEDGHFSDKEIRVLLMRLKGLPSIDVDEAKFTERVKMTRSLTAVLDMMRTISDDNIPEEERIFTISETDPGEGERREEKKTKKKKKKKKSQD
jgi:hypothetical protein